MNFYTGRPADRRRDFFQLVQVSGAEVVGSISRWAGFDIDNIKAENEAPVARSAAELRR